MAEEIAREIVAQSQAMYDGRSPLALKFEQETGKCLLLSLLKRDGALLYLITIEDGSNKHVLKYHKWDKAFKLVNAYAGADSDTTSFAFVDRSSDADIHFKLVCFGGGSDAIEIAQYKYGKSNYASFETFVLGKLSVLDGESF